MTHADALTHASTFVPWNIGTINVGEDRELRYWSGVLRIDPLLLRAAVRAVGSRSDKVWHYLKRLH